MLVRSYDKLSGHGSVINNFCIGLRKIGFKTTIGAFSFQNNPPSGIEKVNLNVSNFKNIINSSSFDIIHNHHTLMNYCSLFTSKPFIFHYHGYVGLLQKINLKTTTLLCHHKFSRVIVFSKESFSHFGNQLRAVPINVIYGGVDTQFYHTSLPRPYVKGNPQLLYVGNLYWHKNVKILIKAMNPILEIFPKAHLQIIGAGPDFRLLSKFIQEKKLRNHVELLGEVDKEELRLRYASCDYLISASTKELGSQPALEAMACGKSVLFADLPCYHEMLMNSKVVRLFSPYDVFDIRKKLSEMYKQKEATSSVARKFAEQHDWRIKCIELEKIYNDI